MSSAAQLFITIIFASFGVAMSNNCWEASVTLSYNVGPRLFTLKQSDAENIMTQVLNKAKQKLASCSGLSIQLLKVIITSESGKYGIVGSYGIFYGNMGNSQKQTAFRCLGQQQIYSDILSYPEIYTSPIYNSEYPHSATMTNPQETTCIISSRTTSSISPTPTPTTTSTTTNVTTASPSLFLPTSSAYVFASSTSISPTSIRVSAQASPSLVMTTPYYQSTTRPPTQAPTTVAAQIKVLKCYETTVILYYNISQNISLSQLSSFFVLAKLIRISDRALHKHSSCNSVQTTVHKYSLTRSLLIGPIKINGSVALVVYMRLEMTSSDNDDVTSTLMTCANYWSTSFKILPNESLPLTLYQSRQSFERKLVVYKRAQSCCGAAPLPCCPGNAIKKSNGFCDHLSFVNFLNTTKVQLGDGMTAICEVSTEADVKVSWIREGKAIQYTENSKRQKLAINAVKTADAGKYICQVENDYQAITRTMELKVIVTENVAMKLTLNGLTFHNDLKNRSSSRYLQMERLVISQIKLGLANKLKNIDKIVIKSFESGSVIIDFQVYLSTILTSPSPSPPDLQSQVVDAMIEQTKKGTFGNLTVGSLVLKVKPPPPSSLAVTDLGTTFIGITWQHPNGASAYEITNYIIQYRLAHMSQTFLTKSIGSGKNSYRLTELKTNTKYHIRIVSRNKDGVVGIPSETLTATTLTVKPIIANNGQNFTFKAGQTAVLVCSGSSDPGPDKVTWSRKHDAAIVTTNVTNNGKIVNTYMVIRNVSVNDSGSYPCSASYGDVTGKGQVTLTVNVTAEVKMSLTLTNVNFTEKLTNNSTPEYKELEKRFVITLEELYRNLTGFERIEVLGFMKGSVKVRFRVVVTVAISKPEANVKQSVAKAEATNRIIRQVKANNGLLGNKLTVKQESIQTDAPPNPPTDVHVIDIKSTEAHLKWGKPLYAKYFSVSHYQVMIKKHGEQFLWEGKVETKLLDCPLKNLREETGYMVKVLAKSGQRVGVESETEEFVTRESSSSLVWLWVLLPLVAITAIIGAAVYIYRHKHKLPGRASYDVNANDTSAVKFEKPRDDTPRIYSYTNQCFSSPALDFESLGIMPGKWWEIPRDSIHLGEPLGCGAFGMVCKASVDIEDGYLTCAVKMLQKTASPEEQADMFQELQTMDTVGRHSNLINLIGACTIDGPVMIVLEFAEKGSLVSYLKDNLTPTTDGEQACSLPDNEKLRIGLDIARGMRHLASVKCVHRDLAARNVLLSGNGQAKIADFGLSRDVYEKGFYEKTTRGKLPVRWMAPEAILQMLFTTQSDVWSYGVVLWEIESGGKLPYSGLDMKEIVNHLKKGFRLPRPVNCKQEIYEIMLCCWNSSPLKRPSFNDLCLKMEELLENQELQSLSMTEEDVTKTDPIKEAQSFF